MAKQIFASILIFIFFVLFCLEFTSKAETINSIQTCNGQKCLSNISDVSISDDGSFFLILDSAGNPYIRKFDFSSNAISNDVVIPINESNKSLGPLMLGISTSNKKAFAYKVTSASIGSTRIINQGKEITLYEQTEQGTDCMCPSNTYFDGMLCVAGTTTCSSTSDPVCGCDNFNYLNSCTAQINGVKKFTKGSCGTMSNFTCANDSQCPIGTCPSGGGTYKQYTCTGAMCVLTQFSSEPCQVTSTSSTSSSSSSGSSINCRCSSGGSSGIYFDGTKCITGKLACTGIASDPVCSCDNLDFLNSCAAQANGVKRFTKGACSTTINLSCNADDQCPLGTCPSGTTFKKFACTGGKCKLVEYTSEPCAASQSSSVSSSSSGTVGSVIHIIDLTNNSIKPIIPSNTTVSKNTTSVTLTPNNQGISAVSFSDSDGNELLVSNNDSSSPKLFITDSKTGEIKQSITLPDIARSIEPSGDFKKAIILFSELLTQSVGIFSINVKKLIKLDMPSDVFFKVDQFLSGVSFDHFGDKCVISSLGGKHVLHLVDLKNDKLVIRLLSNTLEGKTLSAINFDGTIAISVGNISDGEGIVVYKVDAVNLKTMRIRKSVKFSDRSSVIDIDISPDNNSALILVTKENKKILKVLSLRDLSLVCEFTLSDNLNLKGSFLTIDPYERYLLSPNLESDTVNLITNIQSGPVFRSIQPLKGSKEGGTQFTINGYIDQSQFTNDVKVCFGNRNFCAKSVILSDDSKTISGTAPRFPSMTLTSLLLFSDKKEDITDSSSSGSINCSNKFSNVSKYKNVFRFE